MQAERSTHRFVHDIQEFIHIKLQMQCPLVDAIHNYVEFTNYTYAIEYILQY